MKKSIIIIVLCTLQSACAQFGPADLAGSPLLSFEELGGQITVTRIVVEEDGEPAISDAP